MLTLYNTLSKKKEQFEPLKKGKVSMYNCGPTVYSFAHIGNFASYLMADLIRRYLEYLGYEVTQIKNVTDVGHLVADDDDGEDKMEKAAREEKKDPYEIARFYEDAYMRDSERLGILEAHKNPRATEHIEEMIEMIQMLMKKGYAYETEDGVYFDISKFQDYGKLSGNTLEKLQVGKRVEVDEKKKSPFDFALWKKLVGKNEHHIMKWESPWGDGFPGWHIECSAMSRKYLGDQIDIHTGGEDNIFPHHECEIAQSEAFADKEYVKYWIHKRHFFVNGEKMSKSLGNIYTLEDIEEMGYSPFDLRYLFLSAHYRAKLNFTEKGLQDAKIARKKIQSVVEKLQSIEGSGSSQEDKTLKELAENAYLQFEKAMNDDLNTSLALGAVFDYTKEVNKLLDAETLSQNQAGILGAFFEDFNKIFMVLDPQNEGNDIPDEIVQMAKDRVTARKEKNFQKADDLRDKITSLGYEVRDKPNGEFEIISL